jgi:hypothetical protein
VEVIVSNVPGCIDHVPEDFVLESLYNLYITLSGATSKRVLGFICRKEVCYGGTARSFFLSSNTFFLYIRSSFSRFFLAWAFHRSLASKVMSWCKWNMEMTDSMKYNPSWQASSFSPSK